jgi:pimeloyl-ACP methyl ester carboxylesterase
MTLALVGCGGDSTLSDTTPSTTATPTIDGCAMVPVGGEVLSLTTSDGVTLEADRYAGMTGKPGFVLLHMIPPSNTRVDWPIDFIDKLTCEGWSVIAIDRRGAGGSDGTPEDSYIGPGGALDVQAAVEALSEIGAEGIVAIGASNGTTSVLDYTVHAQVEGLPEVIAAGFMTGGGYTEAQNAMSAMGNIPSVFTFSTAERDWSVGQEPLDPGTWAFEEYADGTHGTQMFDSNPSVKKDLRNFFLNVL